MRENVRRRSSEKNDAEQKKPKGGLIAICVIGVLIICAVIFGLLGVLASDESKAMKGVHIGDYDCFGKDVQEITEYLSGIENPYADTSITAKMDDSDKSVTIDAQNIDLKIDIEKTAENAVSYGKKNVFKALGAKISGKDVGYIYSFDSLKLDKLIGDFAKEAGGTLVQHEVNILDTEVVVHAGKDGLGVDTAQLRARVIDAIEPGKASEIKVSKVNTKPADINIDELYEQTKREPQDARYAVVDGNVIVEDEIDGRELDKDEAKNLLRGFAPGSGDAHIPFVMKEAEIKASELSMELFSDVLGSYSTRYVTSNVSRANNVELAARYVNGTILLPGEEFSYNGIVGPRTAARGFREASVYERNQMVDGLGGGICQTSSTIYAAVLYADLEVVERHEHSLEISYAPLGMDATVAYGSLDFRFKNNTDMPIKISMSWGGGTVSAKIIGTNKNKNRTIKINTQTVSTTPYGVTEIKDDTLPEGKTVVDTPGFKGAVVDTYKVIYENGVEIENRFLHKSKYTMVNKVVRVGVSAAPAAAPGEAEQTPSEEQTPEPQSDQTPPAADESEIPAVPEGL